VVVIAAGAEKCRGRPEAGRQLEPQHAVVERQRAVEIGDLEVHVPDADAWVDWLAHR